VRRGLFAPIPTGTVLDDVYWPLCVAMQGYRVVHEERAIAYDSLPPTAACEFRRKVRTLAGNFQLLGRLPRALAPWLNPVAWQLVSRKLLRLAVPWALLVMLACSAILPGALYFNLLGWRRLGYGVGLLGLFPAISTRSRLASAASSFLVLNSAAAVALWVWLRRQTTRSWTKVTYTPDAGRPPRKALRTRPLVEEALVKGGR